MHIIKGSTLFIFPLNYAYPAIVLILVKMLAITIKHYKKPEKNLQDITVPFSVY